MEKKVPNYFLGELEQADTSKLLDEIKTNESLREELTRMQNAYSVTLLSDVFIDESEGRRGFQRFLKLLNAKKQRKAIWLVTRYAAVMLVLIASTFFITRHFLSGSGALGEHGKLSTLVVPAGQRANITLPDGTSVWLNARSTLTYPAHFSGKERRVSVAGEAYFDVAKNPKKPFIVSMSDTEVRVLGTQFNVCSYPATGFTKADLVEGSLMVYVKDAPETSVTLKPNEQVIVKKGRMQVSAIQSPEHFLWKDGIYTFQNELLLDILDKLQLYYDVKIVVKDPEVFKLRYTGKFRQRDGIDRILRVIQKVQPFNIHKDLESNVITITK